MERVFVGRVTTSDQGRHENITNIKTSNVIGEDDAKDVGKRMMEEMDEQHPGDYVVYYGKEVANNFGA